MSQVNEMVVFSVVMKSRAAVYLDFSYETSIIKDLDGWEVQLACIVKKKK